uniref:Family with sequence similarity 120 member B n=1 Tax=Paramormyrops kingsleyae TaxID=1676925 RepID=A0A3B3S575_9TELE
GATRGLRHYCCNDTMSGQMQVGLREIASWQQQACPGSWPSLVADCMFCLQLWYCCLAWVQSGQWHKSLHCLCDFVGAFSQIGIHLVSFFDGVVGLSKEVAALFCYLRLQERQPDRSAMPCLPSALTMFSCFHLKCQETWSMMHEADYEIADYACQHGCMSILGQDTDFLIFDNPMSTVMFSRERRSCIMPEIEAPCHQGNKVFSMVFFIREHRPSEGMSGGVTLLPVSEEKQALLEKGVHACLLPGQWYAGADILEVARENHMEAKCFIVYGILHDGLVECSNSLEDVGTLLPSKGLKYRPARSIYGLPMPTPPGKVPLFGNATPAPSLQSDGLTPPPTTQVSLLCLEDVNTYLSQAVCLGFKSDGELSRIMVS